MLLDRDGTLLAINETGARRFDASPADLVGTNIYDLFPADLRESRRKRIEEAFGWAKTVGAMAKTRHRGRDRVAWQFTLTMAAYNLIRLPKLLERAP